MNLPDRRTRIAFLVALLAAASSVLPLSAQECAPGSGTGSFEGGLYQGLPTLDGRGYVQDFTFHAERFQEFDVSVGSGEFDTYLVLVSPAGDTLRNDDGGDGTDSRIRDISDEAGCWTVLVTSFSSGIDGSFDGWIETGAVGELVASEQVFLPGDFIGVKGEGYDSLRIVPGTAGRLELSIRPFVSDFEEMPGLAVRVEDRRYVAGYSSSMTTQSVRVETGQPVDVFPFVYAPERMAQREGRLVAVLFPDEGNGQAIQGELGVGDETLLQGEYVERHSIRLEEGESVEVALSSEFFDPYLVIVGPEGSGIRMADDDSLADGDGGALLNFIAGASGEWTIYATSYSNGQAGPYRLVIRR